MAAPKKRTKTTRSAGASAPGRSTERRGIAASTRPTTPAKVFTSEPVDISFAGDEHRFARVDLQIEGVDHSGASYEGRVFLDNAKATSATPSAITEGYAGSFHIFGHGGCVGGPGHCEVKDARRDPTDLRRPHPLTPVNLDVEVTEAVRALAKTKASATITIVPVITAANSLCDTANVLKFKGLRLVSYNS